MKKVIEYSENDQLRIDNFGLKKTIIELNIECMEKEIKLEKVRLNGLHKKELALFSSIISCSKDYTIEKVDNINKEIIIELKES